MTRILLLSDTHAHLDSRIVAYAGMADEIWHAGDIGSLEVSDRLAAIKPVRAVYGNIDSTAVRQEFPKDQRFSCEGLAVLMTHIGGYPPSYNARTRNLLTNQPPGLFICGHSHILKVQYDKKLQLLHMNPGACGKFGFHKVRTMLRFEIDGGEIRNLEVIELGLRQKERPA